MKRRKRLTPDEEAQIRRLRAEGMTQDAIALKVKRTRSTVQDVMKGYRTPRPDRSKKTGSGACCECGTTRGPFFGQGKFQRCVEHAGRAMARAKGKRV